ncbi:MAG TPA: UbiA prenyltransferase family protein [Pseudonocardiaceae bacterium]
MSRWRDVIRIHRLEHPFPIHYLCHATLGACYAADGVRQLLAGPVLVVVTANLLSIIGGNPLNAAVDVGADRHTKGKADIADAVLRLGRARAMSWAAAEMMASLVCATAVALWLGRPLVAVGTALSIGLCLLYNLEPARLKRRGFANPVAIGLTLGLLPNLVAYNAVRADLTAPAWLIFIGIAVLITARSLWWTVPDQHGDNTMGLTTPAVRHGAYRTVVVACVMTATGLGLAGWGLWNRYGPAIATLGVAVSLPFLFGKLILLRQLRGGRKPDSTKMRRRDLLSVTIADVFLVLLPLAVR